LTGDDTSSDEDVESAIVIKVRGTDRTRTDGTLRERTIRCQTEVPVSVIEK